MSKTYDDLLFENARLRLELAQARQSLKRKSRSDSKIRKEAVKKGAEERYVTREGYTQLPEIMIHDLGFERDGGNLWFARSKKQWEAWPEGELSEYLGGPEDERETKT